MKAKPRKCSECSDHRIHGKGMCRRCYNRIYYAGQIATPDGLKKRRALERRYKRQPNGFTDDLVANLRRLQAGCCAICCQFLRQGRGEMAEAADHDHGTGAPRGLLCTACNFMVGRHERGKVSDPVMSAACAVYLANPPARRALASQQAAS